MYNINTESFNISTGNIYSSPHINFIYEETSKELTKNNFLQRVGIQYHWENKNYNNFNDFLNNLKSIKRKNITKEREFLKKRKINFSIKKGNEISNNDITLFFQCYIDCSVI